MQGRDDTLLIDILCVGCAPKSRRHELETFRKQFEAEHGETDITRRYTSMLPIEQQRWLMRHEPRRYFQGLPPFLMAFIRADMSRAKEAGTLDDANDGLLRLYMSGGMHNDIGRAR